MLKPNLKELQKGLSTKLGDLILHHGGEVDDPQKVESLLQSVRLFPLGNNLSEYMFIYDYVHNKYTWVSENFTRVTGYDKELLQGKDASSGINLLFNEEDVEFMTDLVESTYRHLKKLPNEEKLNLSIEISARYKNKEEKVFWTRQQWAPLLIDDNGGVILAVGQVSDLSTLVGSISHYYHIKLKKDNQTIILESVIMDYENLKQLTVQERNVLKEVAMGFTTKQIAERLSISFHTVESHRKNIIKKLNCENMQKALALALTRGLI